MPTYFSMPGSLIDCGVQPQEIENNPNLAAFIKDFTERTHYIMVPGTNAEIPEGATKLTKAQYDAAIEALPKPEVAE